MKVGANRTLFRSYSAEAFFPTTTWLRLEHILTGNGGAYGLYGPRGSGKSWLMLRAVEEATRDKGMGLWFPFPSDYDPSAFLSALSDNLASAVERRYIRNNVWWAAMRWLQFGLGLLVAVPVVAAVVSYAGHGLTGKPAAGTLFGTLPVQLWQATAAALGALCLLAVAQFTRANRRAGRLASEATALRERIRYTAALKQGVEANVSGGSRLTASLKRAREKNLDERPTTLASLVFDFRRLAEAIVTTTGKRLVIALDELDKIDDPAAARRLLRDVKGIFEITGVYFLVSVSAEAARALQLGALPDDGRAEFSSSFYTVLELPALDPMQITTIAEWRGWPIDPDLGGLLCLLSAGNLREAIRLAESWQAAGETVDRGASLQLARHVLRSEAAALLQKGARVGDSAASQVLPDAWRALPDTAFESADAFDALSRTAIHDFWDLGHSDPTWRDAMREPWRRFLIRLFVIGQVLADIRASGTTPFNKQKISQLRNVLIMAGDSTAVALLMLKARFGDDLASPYAPPPGTGAITGVPTSLP